jgi:hypothetical protein
MDSHEVAELRRKIELLRPRMIYTGPGGVDPETPADRTAGETIDSVLSILGTVPLRRHVAETAVPADPQGNVLQQIAAATDGEMTMHRVTNEANEVVHAFATMSFPLRKNHWIYQKDDTPAGFQSNVPPMPFRMGAHALTKVVLESDAGPLTVLALSKWQFEHAIRAAGKYAVRCATMNGAEMDFDPDALLQNLVVGMLGYWTDNGLTECAEDAAWCNPQKPFDFTPPPPRNVPGDGLECTGDPTGSNPTPEL